MCLGRKVLHRVRSCFISLPYELAGNSLLCILMHIRKSSPKDKDVFGRLGSALLLIGKLFTPLDLDWFEARIGRSWHPSNALIGITIYGY